MHVSIGPWGGNGGNPFADPEKSFTIPITKVALRSGSLIDNIQMFYGGDSPGAHGGTGGNHTEMQLNPGEHISRVMGTCDPYIHTLTFITSMGRQLSGGHESGRSAFDIKSVHHHASEVTL